MSEQLAGRRSRYDEGCAAAFALGVVADRWALLVVRELMFSHKGFQLIRAGLPGVTASVLTARLTDLAAAGIVRRDETTGRYGLTDDGRALRPVLDALGHWGVGRPGHDPRKFLSPTALMLSMGVMVRPELAAGCVVTAGFELPREGFVVQFDSAGRPVVAPAEEPSGDVVFVGDGNAVAAALYSPAPVADLVALHMLEVRGSLSAAQSFAGAFRTLPAPG